MAEELRGKVAIVTGGTRGIGLSIAQRLLAEGAKVFICGRNAGHLKAALDTLGKQSDGSVGGVAADMRRYDDCRKVVQGAAEKFGGLDILINNAGVGY
ncbi:MAG: SDR family NAD(P)-dependent oxidoreductase, partial [Limisphaerales bacterium]